MNETQIQELAQVIANQAQAIADDRVPVPMAAAKRLRENVETMLAWMERLADERREMVK